MTGHRPDGPAPLLFLAPDTGGGHLRDGAGRYGRARAELSRAICAYLVRPVKRSYSPWVVRHVTGQYGALTRRAPWAWGALYRASDSARAVRFLQRTLFSGIARAIEAAIEVLHPAAVVSFHALTTEPAVRAARRAPYSVPVITVVTDIASVHRAWRAGEAACIAAPSGPVVLRFLLDGVSSGTRNRDRAARFPSTGVRTSFRAGTSRTSARPRARPQDLRRRRHGWRRGQQAVWAGRSGHWPVAAWKTST